MELNKYNMYSINVDNNMTSAKSQLMEEIEQMKQIYDYAQINDFIERHYGKLDNWLNKEFCDGKKLGILKEDNTIELAILDENGIVFGRRWEFIPDESPEE